MTLNDLDLNDINDQAFSAKSLTWKGKEVHKS